MPHNIRLMIEQRERETLSPHAMLSAESAGRRREEDSDPVRTCYQRDRDRILHSKPFRRLKHKTQVFLDPVGDHYRTRLTHSLEVAQIARTVGRALRLNEDLIEAIALGHDVGHTPFGHAGESALDEFLQENKPAGAPEQFRHYEQSLRVFDVLTDINLTHETRNGIDGHSKGKGDLTAFDGQPTSTLEAAVVRISDRIAYMNHDLEDAIRSGMISKVPAEFERIGSSHGKRISAMVYDVIENSFEKPSIILSDEMLATMNKMKDWLFENVYERYPIVYPDIPKAKRIVKELMVHFLQPGNLPAQFSGPQGAIDYIAGMTDRYAIETYERLYIPSSFRESFGD